MLNDLLTVMWKERKGLLRYRGGRTRFLVALLSPFLLAIYGPLRDGPEWVEQEGSVILAMLVSVILVVITIPDSFAGERERHTLETLLASRLPDRAILFGKIVVSVAFSWGATLLVLGLGLVMVNVIHWGGGLLLFAPRIALAALTLSFLLATLAAGVGVLISLRSATVQEAAQALTAIFLVPPMLLTIVLLMFNEQLGDAFGTLSGEQILLTVLTALTIADLVTYGAAMVRFRRARLIMN
jgi:ABC-2 type transport system permease protein